MTDLGDKVYDLIGLEIGQAVGAMLLLLLLVISGHYNNL